MRKVLCIIICILSIVLPSCEMNAPLRNKMTEYYSQDENYMQLEGRIVGTQYIESLDHMLVEIVFDKEKYDFPYNASTGYGEFVLVHWSSKQYSLQENDRILFTSAPGFFYNGHNLPLVHIEKEGITLLTYTEGKKDYLSWINEYFSA